MSLDDEDIIRITRPHGGGDAWDPNVVNFNYVLKTGKIPDNTHRLFGFRSGKYYIDWNKDDAFTRALKTIEQRSAGRIRQSQALQDLLAKRNWSKADRQQWEQGVSQIVAEETAKIPGFANYRTSAPWEGQKRYRTDAKDIDCLNDLSSDIAQNTEHLRFDCGVESIIKGVTIQKLENSFLPGHAASTRDFKKAGSYFYATGGINSRGDNGEPLNHASIFTPAGNTIEGTSAGYSYARSLYPDSTLERLVRGKAFFAADGSVYDQPDSGGPPASAARLSAKQSHDDRHEDGQIFSRSDLWNRDGHDGTRVSEAAEDGFIVLATKRADGLGELKIFQKQMAGSPQEGYVMVGYESGREEHRAIETIYNDDLTGKIYKFSAIVEPNDVRITVARETHCFGIDWKDNIVVQERKPLSSPARRDPQCGIRQPAQAATGSTVEKGAAERLLILAQMRPEYRAYARTHHLGAEPDGVWGEGTRQALEALVSSGHLDARTFRAIESMYGNGGDLHGRQVDGAAALAYMKEIKHDPNLKAIAEPATEHKAPSSLTPRIP